MANDPMLLEIRDRLVDRIDRRLAVILTGSLAVHVAIASFAWAHDVELPQAHPYVAVPLYQQDMIIDVTLPEPPVVAPSPEPGHAGIAKPTTTKGHTRSIVQPAPVNGQSLAGLLTNNEETRTAPKLALPSIDAQPHPMIGNGTHTSRVDDEVHPSMLPAPTITDDQTLTHVTPRDEHERAPRVIPGTVKPEQSTTLTAAVVLERIQSTYLAGLQRCYRLGLAEDSTLSGRVMVSFTVDERGQVADPDADGLSSKVDQCISDQMTRWRFPVPTDKGSPTEASFSVSLALQPS